MKRAFVALGLLVLVPACASHQASGQQVRCPPGQYCVESVEADQFSRDVKITGGTESLRSGDTIISWKLITRIDRGTRSALHEIFVEVFHTPGINNFIAATDERAMPLSLVPINAYVDECHVGYCNYNEEFGLVANDTVLRAHAQTGYTVKVLARSGASAIIALSPFQIQSQLDMADKTVTLLSH